MHNFESVRGPEIPPGTAEYRLVASLVDATAERLGRPSQWDRRLFEELNPSLQGTGGLHPERAMTLSRALVLTPARPVVDGRRLTSDEIRPARCSMLVIVHEALHLDTVFGDESDDLDAPSPTSSASLEKEEALVDIMSSGVGDDVVNRVGLDQVNPELVGLQGLTVYPMSRRAMLGVAKEVAGWSGLATGQVVRELKATPLTRRWTTAADLVLDQQLGAVDESERSALRREIHIPLRRCMMQARTISLDKTLPDDERYARVDRAVATATAEVNEMIARHTSSAAVEPAVRDASVSGLRQVLDSQAAPLAVAASKAPVVSTKSVTPRPQPTQAID